MLKIMAMVIALLVGTVSARALDTAANTALLREYARVAIKINDELAVMAQLLASDPERRILLMPEERATFCVQVKRLMTNLSRKMRLLEPGVIVASDFFHYNGNEATRNQMLLFQELTEKYPDHFRPCEMEKPQ